MSVPTPKRAFVNRLRTLTCIDRWQLPELSGREQAAFMADPFRFLMRADEAQSDAIWREVEKRQTHSVIAAAPDLAEALAECVSGLAEYISAEYPSELREQYSGLRNRYERDMALVHRARTALAKARGEQP